MLCNVMKTDRKQFHWPVLLYGKYPQAQKFTTEIPMCAFAVAVLLHYCGRRDNAKGRALVNPAARPLQTSALTCSRVNESHSFISITHCQRYSGCLWPLFQEVTISEDKLKHISR